MDTAMSPIRMDLPGILLIFNSFFLLFSESSVCFPQGSGEDKLIYIHYQRALKYTQGLSFRERRQTNRLFVQMNSAWKAIYKTCAFPFILQLFSVFKYGFSSCPCSDSFYFSQLKDDLNLMSRPVSGMKQAGIRNRFWRTVYPVCKSML